jgi:hypothetical protein
MYSSFLYGRAQTWQLRGRELLYNLVADRRKDRKTTTIDYSIKIKRIADHMVWLSYGCGSKST